MTTPAPHDPMATRHAASARFARAATVAGAHPVADALHAIAEDLNAPGDHPYWGALAAALAPDVATEAELADVAADLAQQQADLRSALGPDDSEPQA